MEITLTRKGKFLGHTPTNTQCGKTKRLRYTYEVIIVCKDTDISVTDGFVFDNALVEGYFKTKYEVNKAKCFSCELMTSKAVKDLKFLIQEDRNIVPQSISVSIAGSTHSFITAKL